MKQPMLILLIVVLFTGGKRLRTLGEDLGIAYKGFKKAFNEDDDTETKNIAKIEKIDK